MAKKERKISCTRKYVRLAKYGPIAVSPKRVRGVGAELQRAGFKAASCGTFIATDADIATKKRLERTR